MRPYFFNQNRGYQAESSRSIAYRKSQRTASTEKTKRYSKTITLIKKVLRIFTGKRQLAPWELKAIQDAKEKRSRRRARNILWWSNDLGLNALSSWR